MDYIIMHKMANGEFKPIIFKDGIIPIYHDKDEALSDMVKGDALFKIEMEKGIINK